MRQLLLLRHAEAEPVQSGQIDAERCLTAHGRQQAQRVGEQLRSLGLQPDAMLISPTTRTRQTAQILAAQLGLGVEPQCEPVLYVGACEALLAALRTHPATTRCLLVIGHNPGLSALAQHLAGSRVSSAEARALELPTAGLCCFEVEAPAWQQLGPRVVQSVSTP